MKILIIKLGALGDVVMATPHIEQIVAYHPHDEVHLLTAPAYVPLFAQHPRLQVTAFPRKGRRAMVQALVWVRRQRFDVVYDLQGSDRSKAMTLISRAQRRIGMGRGFPYTLYPPVAGDRNRHIFVRLNELLDIAGLPAAAPRPRLYPGVEEQAHVARWLAEHRLQRGKFVLMHAGSSPVWLSKRWPVPYFARLALGLASHGLATVWIGGEDERALNRELALQTGIDATAIFSIPGLSVLAAYARFAITNDSGPMHVLATAGIPVYAFFGPTSWARSHAIGQQGRILTAGAQCSPCFAGQCPLTKDRHHCMTYIAPEQVLALLQCDGLIGRA